MYTDLNRSSRPYASARRLLFGKAACPARVHPGEYVQTAAIPFVDDAYYSGNYISVKNSTGLELPE